MKKSRMHKVGMLAGAIFAGMVILAGQASAAITVSTSSVNLPLTNDTRNVDIVAAWSGNPILTNNLAQSGTFTLLSGGYPYGGNVINLNDGLMVSSVSGSGTNYYLDNTANSAPLDNGASPSQVKLVLNNAADLTKIDVFTSYEWNRTGQKWEVFTSTDGGTNWSATPLASVNFTNSNTAGEWNSRRVTVTDSTPGTFIATNVNALRFDIYDTDLSGGGDDIAVFNEIAVYGTGYAGPAQILVSSSVVNIPQGGSATNANVVAAWGGNPILTNDLAQSGTITLLSGGYPFGGNVANLIDGLMVSSIGSGYILDDTANSATFDNGASPSQVKLVLNGTYDLAKIDVFTSYAWNRTGQKWEVFTSTDGGTTWSATPLASVNYPNTTSGGYDSRRVTISESGSGAIATNVNALRFDIYDTDTSGGGADISVYSEIAVYAVSGLPGQITVSSSVVNIPQGGSATNANVVAAWGGNPILSGDLAQSGTITLEAGVYPFGGNVSNLIDGLMVSSIGSGYTLDATENSATLDNSPNPSQVKLVLNGTYDLARIDVFTSYQYTRTGQKWEVFTSSDGGTTWSATPLASVNYPNTFSGGYDSRRVTISESSSGAIATGVNALRFDIYNTDTTGGGNDIAIYSEIAVYAVQSQPPQLNIALNGNDIQLSWPGGLGWTLQKQTNGLASGGWVNVPGSTTVTSTNMTIDRSAPAVFFRLKQ